MLADALFQWPTERSISDYAASVAAHRAAPTPCLLPTPWGTYDRRCLDFLEEHGCEPGARFASEVLPPNFWSLRGREYWCTGCGMIKRTAEGRTDVSATEIYSTPQLSGIILEPIRDTGPPEYFQTPKYKRWLARLRSSRKRRTTFKQRMRDCWHMKKLIGGTEAALAAMRRTKR